MGLLLRKFIWTYKTDASLMKKFVLNSRYIVMNNSHSPLRHPANQVVTGKWTLDQQLE